MLAAAASERCRNYLFQSPSNGRHQLDCVLGWHCSGVVVVHRSLEARRDPTSLRTRALALLARRLEGAMDGM